ncbi:hypothetical protein [Calothrix sp. PCC 6303]|uniref:hypothetical protein n=1 Tax=Calothrix sp. PCC 6303 TaxID=1170562 RepID=UPI0002A03F98|nr:hypothetical protein [Calothrix sp. PCC 6303]AFZ01631.1 hypothetical protein Cal6303_2658 [Calothrix sp. PCC 6303]
MAVYTRGKKRDILTYVAVYPTLLYGFKTKDFNNLAGITTANLVAQLGHLLGDFTPPAGSIRVIGANTPKPNRVTKRIANAGVGSQQSVSTFCSSETLTNAMSGGWNVTKQRRGVNLRPETSSKNTLTAIATLSDGSLYCYPMNKADYTTYAEPLGLTNSAGLGSISPAERGKLVSGSTIPRPGKAAIEVSGGGIFSTFYSTANKDALATAGFSILTDESVFALAVTP